MALDLIPHKPLLDKFLACTTQEDLQAIIQEYYKDDTPGMAHKVNLTYGPSESNGEGIWATFVSPEDKAKYEKDSSGFKYLCLLLNAPLGWGGRVWGSPIIATTNGKSRPVAILDDQKELDNIAKHLFEILQKRYQEEASSSSTL